MISEQLAIEHVNDSEDYLGRSKSVTYILTADSLSSAELLRVIMYG